MARVPASKRGLGPALAPSHKGMRLHTLPSIPSRKEPTPKKPSVGGSCAAMIGLQTAEGMQITNQGVQGVTAGWCAHRCSHRCMQCCRPRRAWRRRAEACMLQPLPRCAGLWPSSARNNPRGQHTAAAPHAQVFVREILSALPASQCTHQGGLPTPLPRTRPSSRRLTYSPPSSPLFASWACCSNQRRHSSMRTGVARHLRSSAPGGARLAAAEVSLLLLGLAEEGAPPATKGRGTTRTPRSCSCCL